MSNGREEFEVRRLRKTKGNNRRQGSPWNCKKKYKNKQTKNKSNKETRRDQSLVIARV
jgi:hypothetical protein